MRGRMPARGGSMYVSVRPKRRHPVLGSPNLPRVKLGIRTLESMPVRNNLLTPPAPAPPAAAAASPRKNDEARPTKPREQDTEKHERRSHPNEAVESVSEAPRMPQNRSAPESLVEEGVPPALPSTDSASAQDNKVGATSAADATREDSAAPAAAMAMRGPPKPRPTLRSDGRDARAASTAGMRERSRPGPPAVPAKGHTHAVKKPAAGTRNAVAANARRPKPRTKIESGTDVTKPHPQGAITDYEFDQGIAALRDVQSGVKAATHPDGTPLELLFENKRFKCWFAEVDGLLCTMTEAQFNIAASKIHKTLTDFDYQKTYDEYIKHKSVIDHVDGCEVVFHEVKLPSPLTNRDYVYYRKRVTDEQAGVYKWYQRDLPDWGRQQRAEVKGVIRAGRGDFWLHALLEKTGEDSCKMIMLSQDNPCGDIPKWVMNFVTKKGIPSFFKGVEEAAQQLSVRAGEMTEKEFKAWKKAYSSTV